MTLKTKILGVLLVFVLLYEFFSYGIYRLVLYPSYKKLERSQAEKDLNRCLEALENEIRHLDSVTYDWAAWDDSYRFVQDMNREFVETNLMPQTFIQNRLNLIFFLDENGERFWGEVRDFETGKNMEAPDLLVERFAPTHAFMRPGRSSKEPAAGVFPTNEGPLLVASRPVVSSLYEGPSRGFLIMGRFLGESYMRTLSRQTRVEHRYRPVDSTEIPEKARALLAMADRKAVPVFEEKDSETIRVFSIVNGMEGRPALLASADVPREIMKNFQTTMYFFIMSSVCSGGALLIIMFFMLKNVVIDPLRNLTERVISFENPENPMPALYLTRKDEIGTLCRRFDLLFTRLDSTFKGLEETNERLTGEIRERKKSREKLKAERARLRDLTYELLITEEREKRRLAVDLHDQVGQNLAICKMKLSAMDKSNFSLSAHKEFEWVKNCLDETIREIRTLTFEISPPVLYELGLKSALAWLGEKTASLNGIEIRVEGEPAGNDLDDSLKALLYRTVRELLHNVVKHAEASEATVQIEPSGDFLSVTVSDDGIGFDSEKNGKNDGFGLFSIRERFGSIGGEFKIRSAPGAGTEAILKVPLSRGLSYKRP